MNVFSCRGCVCFILYHLMYLFMSVWCVFDNAWMFAEKYICCVYCNVLRKRVCIDIMHIVHLCNVLFVLRCRVHVLVYFCIVLNCLCIDLCLLCVIDFVLCLDVFVYVVMWIECDIIVFVCLRLCCGYVCWSVLCRVVGCVCVCFTMICSVCFICCFFGFWCVLLFPRACVW